MGGRQRSRIRRQIVDSGGARPDALLINFLETEVLVDSERVRATDYLIGATPVPANQRSSIGSSNMKLQLNMKERSNDKQRQTCFFPAVFPLFSLLIFVNVSLCVEESTHSTAVGIACCARSTTTSTMAVMS